MLIRQAVLADLNGCLAVDADSQTDHVWQMDERTENASIAIRFHTIRLPRVMRVTYPRGRDDLLSCWENGSTILVASDKPTPASDTEWTEADQESPAVPRIFAYCQLDICHWQKVGWVNHLIVDRRLRRRGIGTVLLRTSIAWGKQHRLERLMIAIQTKNYPAISFCEKHGFSFCGFNDHYFPNRDIALFFALRI
jgi:GNAT superfamily N-acetyltransferase